MPHPRRPLTAADDTRTTFFAIWPEPPARAALRALACRLADREGRPTSEATLHLTLVFLGRLPQARVPEYRAAADGIVAAPFDLCFDRVERRDRQRMAWATPFQTPVGLADLVADLTGRLEAAGLPYERRPYRPHITLVRDLPCARGTVAETPVAWGARGFALLRGAGAGAAPGYEQVGYWTLGSAPVSG